MQFYEQNAHVFKFQSNVCLDIYEAEVTFLMKLGVSHIASYPILVYIIYKRFSYKKMTFHKSWKRLNISCQIPRGHLRSEYVH